MEIFEKRGRWCFVDEAGKIHKFGTEEEAKIAAGWAPPVEEPVEEEPKYTKGKKK